MHQLKSPSKPFLAKNHRVLLPTSPRLPSLPERPEAGHRREGAAKHSTWLWVWGQQKSRSLQGPSAFTRLYPPLHTHTLSPLNTHLRRMGKAHSRPSGRSEATGTVIPQSYTPLSSLFSTSSPSPLSCRLRPPHVIRQTVSCCITHTPLCPCLRRFQPCSLM